jgi:hypothetical protein
VAGCCEYGDESSGSGATDLVAGKKRENLVSPLGGRRTGNY